MAGVLKLKGFLSFNLSRGSNGPYGFRLSFEQIEANGERRIFYLYLRSGDDGKAIVGRKEVESDMYDEEGAPRTLRTGTAEFRDACVVLASAISTIGMRENSISVGGTLMSAPEAVREPAWQAFETMVASAENQAQG